MNGSVSQEMEELVFTNFKLEIMILHPCRYAEDGLRYCQRLKDHLGERQVYLSVIRIAGVRKSVISPSEVADMAKSNCP